VTVLKRVGDENVYRSVIMYRNVLKTRPEEDSIYIPLETYLKTVPSLQRVTSKVDTNDLMDSHILNTSHFGRFTITSNLYLICMVIWKRVHL
jgi:hypothetical protein